MHLVRLTALNNLLLCLGLLIVASTTQAQDNAPYSRYGLGFIVPQQNITSKGMGGISAGVMDNQSINFINPASISGLRYTTFDLAAEVDNRTLKSNNAPDKYTSTNTNISYLMVGVPIAPAKMVRKGNNIGLVLGLKPVTRINYKIQDNKRISGIDSTETIYEGSGGLNQVMIGSAVKLKRFSAGITLNYNFGNRNISSRLALLNDSSLFFKSNYEQKSNFSCLNLTAGFQYEIPTKKGQIRLGAYGSLPGTMNATGSKLNSTFFYDAFGQVSTIDTIDYSNNYRGKVKLPPNFGLGFTYADKEGNWIIGVDYDNMLWSQFSYYGNNEGMQNSFHIRAGAQYLPAKNNTPTTKYFRYVKYRLGIYVGQDVIKLNNNRKDFGVTVGAGFPLTTLLRKAMEFTTLNTAIEFGKIGDKSTGLIRENVLRFNLGFSMNARWFIKRKYD